MKRCSFPLLGLIFLISVLILFVPTDTNACSTFKLQKGDQLIYGHNLNQGDIGVPGLVFINKRSMFKMGRSWSELTTNERLNPSSHCWISRYGSVTFNNFGRDFPDGGMNEVGLYIWEMNEDADYPRNDSMPKLNQMNWMQYILDNFSTVEEVMQGACEIEIDGWGWHYFLGDANGNTAAIAFINGEAVVNKGEKMPVPALFNTPYERELELLGYYKGFGGLYEPELKNPEVPRFVKTAVMIRDYDPGRDIMAYGFQMLEIIKVNDVPEWSIICDVRNRNVYFRTRINPEIKKLSMNDIDFSINTPVLIVNMDIKDGGDVFDKFHTYTNAIIREFTEDCLFPIIPEGFFTRGGITKEEYLDRISTHSDRAALHDNQFFKGVWKNKPDTEKDEWEVTIFIETKAEAVSGLVSLSADGEESYKADHIHMIGNQLNLTFITKKKTFIEVQASIIDDEKMDVVLYGIEDNYGSYTLFKVE